MAKGSHHSSPRSTADRYLTSESAQSLPPVRVCTPPAHGEGSILRAIYTSSSSDASDRTPPRRQRAATGDGSLEHETLPHWHSLPADNGAAADDFAGEASHEQAHFRREHFRTPELASHSSSASPAPACCPHCPDSEARLAAARDAVVDLMLRLTDATEERDEALEAASREWRLAELLRQQLAGTPGHPTADAASSGGRAGGGLRSSRLPQAATPERFDADWEAARQDLAAAASGFCGDGAFLTPRSSWASPAAQQAQRRQSGGSSPAFYSPAQQTAPGPQLSPRPPPGAQQPTPRRRLPAQRRLDDGSGCAWQQTPPRQLQRPSPSVARLPLAAAALPPSVTPEQAALRQERAERSAAEERAVELEQRLRAADGVIWRLLSEPHAAGDGASAGEVAAQLSGRLRGTLKADSMKAAATIANGGAIAADGLLLRLQELAAQAADASRPSGGGGGTRCSSGGRPLADGGAQPHGRRHRLSSVSQERPDWLGADTADAAVVSSAAAATAVSLRRQPPSDGGPLAKMHAAVAQLDAAAARLGARSAAGSHAGLPATSVPASLAGGAEDELVAAAATRVALKRARMDMVAAVRTLACRKAETMRLLSPSKLQPVGVAKRD